MPGTVEALLILLVFVMPGFITARTRELLVPSVRKPDALQITLRSITVSLLFLPLWLLATPDLLRLRGEVAMAVAVPGIHSVSMTDRGVIVFFALVVLLPVFTGVVWAVAYWNGWYVKAAEHFYPRLGLRVPTRGVGEGLWDKLWLNRERQPWLTVYMKDGRIYVGRGMEFSLSSDGRDLLLGPDSRLFNKDGDLIKDLATSGGESVWIPAGEVSSIDVHQ